MSADHPAPLDVTIRPAGAADRAQIAALKPSQADVSIERRLRETRSGESVYLVAIDGDRVVGHVFLRLYGNPSDPNAPVIEDLYIHAGFRGRGIGTALLVRCEAIAREGGYPAIQLSVGVQNEGAQRLYTRFGYVATGRPVYIGGVYEGMPERVMDLKKTFAVNDRKGPSSND
ncbi:GNAT family N-acetyltransferase [Aggregatilinea lenta]|uniref:GNAT family N-acetyltransferase n=1 Tax=Aggregatilinea lenta TaxID=913108 RepID=UPI0013C3613C|nr:GNAT family N-acetyltransferase [Aggregatilinea lenta]